MVFILATTEPQKVPATIRSRCQHIPFRRISVEDITARLAEVARSEGVSFDERPSGRSPASPTAPSGTPS
ncbi:hypothetical protein MASR2M79_18300 [Aminivibrio sp.]